MCVINIYDDIWKVTKSTCNSTGKEKMPIQGQEKLGIDIYKHLYAYIYNFSGNATGNDCVLMIL